MGFLDTNVWNPGISTAGITHTLQFGNALPKKDRIDKDPKYKDVKNWLESLPKI